MLSRLAWDSDTIDNSHCVIELIAILLITAFDGPPARGNYPMGGVHKLHLVWPEGEEVESAVVAIFRPSVGH
jgi:hypothetical protein